MTGATYSHALHENYGVNAIEITQQAIPQDAFALKRARYLSDIEQVLLNEEQRLALLDLIKADDFDAKRRVAAHNLRLVAGIAMRYANRGIDFLELARIGALGLMHALEKFELEGGFRFSVYARRCIRDYIERAIRDGGNRLHVVC